MCFTLLHTALPLPFHLPSTAFLLRFHCHSTAFSLRFHCLPQYCFLAFALPCIAFHFGSHCPSTAFPCVCTAFHFPFTAFVLPFHYLSLCFHCLQLSCFCVFTGSQVYSNDQLVLMTDGGGHHPPARPSLCRHPISIPIETPTHARGTCSSARVSAAAARWHGPCMCTAFHRLSSRLHYLSLPFPCVSCRFRRGG